MGCPQAEIQHLGPGLDSLATYWPLLPSFKLSPEVLATWQVQGLPDCAPSAPTAHMLHRQGHLLSWEQCLYMPGSLPGPQRTPALLWEPAALSTPPPARGCRFTKFHSNDGSISHPEPCLQAFSHWTWHYWAQAAQPEEAVVVDLQGIKEGMHEFVLTDPAIHTCNSRRSVVNPVAHSHQKQQLDLLAYSCRNYGDTNRCV